MSEDWGFGFCEWCGQYPENCICPDPYDDDDWYDDEEDDDESDDNE